MTTKKIYGPCIKWSGGKCPVSPDTEVVVTLRSGAYGKAGPAKRFYWYHDGDDDDGDIVEYCIVTDQADLNAAENLLLTHGYTVTPPAKQLTFEDVVPMTEAPLKGTRYWVVSAVDCDGVYSVPFGNDALDRLVIKRRMAYLKHEHALIAARHIFGLKGGEL